jgi:hypothetical protein
MAINFYFIVSRDSRMFTIFPFVGILSILNHLVEIVVFYKYFKSKSYYTLFFICLFILVLDIFSNLHHILSYIEVVEFNFSLGVSFRNLQFFLNVIYGAVILIRVTKEDLFFKIYGAYTLILSLLSAYNIYSQGQLIANSFYLNLIFPILLLAVYFTEIKAFASRETNDELIDIE